MLPYIFVLLTSLIMNFAYGEAPSAPANLDAEILKLEAEMLRIAERQSASYAATGRIVRALEPTDVPEAVTRLKLLGIQPLQLLQVHVGEPAVLAMVENSYQTTGRFSADMLKVTDLETNMGKTPLFIEYVLSKQDKERAPVLMDKLSHLVAEKLIGDIKITLPQIDKVKMNNVHLALAEMAALRAVHAAGRSKMEGRPLTYYSGAKDLVLCALKGKYGLTPKTWEPIYSQVFSATEDLARGLMCAGDKYAGTGGKKISFHECMCGIPSDAVLPLSKGGRQKFEDLLAEYSASIERPERQAWLDRTWKSKRPMFDAKDVKFSDDKNAWMRLPANLASQEKVGPDICEADGGKLNLNRFTINKYGQMALKVTCDKKKKVTPPAEFLAALKAKRAEIAGKLKQNLPPSQMREIKEMSEDWKGHLVKASESQDFAKCPEDYTLDSVGGDETKAEWELVCIKDLTSLGKNLCTAGSWNSYQLACTDLVCADGKSMATNKYGQKLCVSCPDGSEVDPEQIKELESSSVCRIAKEQVRPAAGPARMPAAAAKVQ